MPAAFFDATVEGTTVKARTTVKALCQSSKRGEGRDWRCRFSGVSLKDGFVTVVGL